MARPDELPPEDPRFALPRRRPGSLHTIETVLLASTACLLAAVAWPIATGQIGGQSLAGAGSAPLAAAPNPDVAPVATPTIQLALLLDTSGSMEGLIDQARSRLWNVVNALDAATFHGARPRLEVAVYEYGNDGVSAQQGHIRRVVGFTGELDEVSRALYSLSIRGGSEHAPQAIERAAHELQWADGDGVLRVVYVAGNESFQQGPVAWSQALGAADAEGIVVNTVFCGPDDDDDASQWSAVAAAGHGRSFRIDHNARVVDPTTPFDAQIGQLGVAINDTYVGYGKRGRDGLANQVEQDNNSLYSNSQVSRGLSKSSASYANPSWDLVDAVNEGAVDLETLPDEALPLELRGLDAGQRAAAVAARKARREEIVGQLAQLRSDREAYLQAHRDVQGPASLDVAMIEAVTEQARRVGFTL
jgi:von Willebrand factor type A domain